MYKKHVKAGKFIGFSINEISTFLNVLNLTPFIGHPSIFFLTKFNNLVYDLNVNSMKKVKVVYNPNKVLG